MSLIGAQCYIEVNHQYNHIHSHLFFIVLICVVNFVFNVSKIIYADNKLAIDFSVFYAFSLTSLLAVMGM